MGSAGRQAPHRPAPARSPGRRRTGPGTATAPRASSGPPEARRSAAPRPTPARPGTRELRAAAPRRARKLPARPRAAGLRQMVPASRRASRPARSARREGAPRRWYRRPAAAPASTLIPCRAARCATANKPICLTTAAAREGRMGQLPVQLPQRSSGMPVPPSLMLISEPPPRGCAPDTGDPGRPGRERGGVLQQLGEQVRGVGRGAPADRDTAAGRRG